MINVIPTAIPGVVIIEPKVFGDARGYFFESFSERDFNEAMTPILGHGIKFVQDNESMSSYGVMRGLHFQTPPFTQSKLVRCVKGAVLSETAVFQYKCDNYYAPANDGGISIKDDSLGIDWRIPVEKALLSEKDTKHALLKDFDSPFSIDMDLYPEL